MPHIVTLEPGGRQFDVDQDETILAAAKRAGLAFMPSCSSAECGRCEVRLISGRVREQTVSSPARLRVLACKAVPTSDLTLALQEAAGANIIPKRELPVVVLDKALLAPDIMRIRLSPVSGMRLERLPGQYLNVLLSEDRRRAFSIANAPTAGDHIELHVRRVAGGDFTHQVFADMEAGTRMRIEGPLGTFVPRENSDRPMLFIAGGTGFAPVKALLEHFLGSGTRRRTTLYWGARYAADLYQHAMLLDWANRHDNFHYIPVVSEPDNPPGWRQGSALQAVVEDLTDLPDHDVYFSGPPQMIEACQKRLVAAGAARDRLFRDSADCVPDTFHPMGQLAAISGR